MSELVSELLNFFDEREGQHVSDVDIEAVMHKAAERIEQLEALESAVREMLNAGDWRLYEKVQPVEFYNPLDNKGAELIKAVRDKLGEEL